MENTTVDGEFTRREKLLHSEFLSINIISTGSFLDFLLLLCFWFTDVGWQPGSAVDAKRDQLDSRPEHTPAQQESQGKSCGGRVCVRMCMLVYVFICF